MPVAVKAVDGKKIPRWKHRAGSTPAPGTITRFQGFLKPQQIITNPYVKPFRRPGPFFSFH